jgi:hypothetical protein
LTYYDTLISSIDDAYDKRTNTYWLGSVFERLISLTNDERGRWGEDLLQRFLTLSGIANDWDGDSNTKPTDGIYDIKVTSTDRLEVKTATSEDNWQHENIYSRPLWDKIAFIDVDYDHIYLTVLSYDDLAYILVPDNVQHTELRKGATLRGSQTDKYKFDFSRRTRDLAIKAGHTLAINIASLDNETITTFLLSKFL